MVCWWNQLTIYNKASSKLNLLPPIQVTLNSVTDAFEQNTSQTPSAIFHNINDTASFFSIFSQQAFAFTHNNIKFFLFACFRITLDLLLIAKGERNSDFGIHEEWDRVELWTVHSILYTTRFSFWLIHPRIGGTKESGRRFPGGTGCCFFLFFLFFWIRRRDSYRSSIAFFAFSNVFDFFFPHL